MRVKSIFCGVGAAWSLWASAGAARADNARLPYHLLYEAQKTRTELNQAHTNLLIVLTVQSTRPGVKTSDLILYIDAKGGPIPIQVGAAGDFVIPLRDDLLEEDPWIVVNQPKGTMKLNWEVGLVPGRLARSLRYARLMRPVAESQVVQEQVRRFSPGSPRLAATGLRMAFAHATTRASVIIHARSGDQKLEANADGEVVIPLTPDLLDEDPEMTLSDSPKAVEIVSRAAGG
jgi:hypothetical protein